MENWDLLGREILTRLYFFQLALMCFVVLLTLIAFYFLEVNLKIGKTLRIIGQLTTLMSVIILICIIIIFISLML